MGIHHLLTYNISIQYVLVIHVHVTYRVCTSEVKTDEETKNRQKRIQAHRIFDQIWQQGILSKPEAYRWVADKFCLTDKQAHIGQFSNYMCDQLIRESADVLKNNHIPFRLRAAS